jgi:hypothetical protein
MELQGEILRNIPHCVRSDAEHRHQNSVKSRFFGFTEQRSPGILTPTAGLGGRNGTEAPCPIFTANRRQTSCLSL